MLIHDIVSLSDVALTKEKMTTLEWDSIVEKNEALQKGDWRKMTLEEKKAGTIITSVGNDLKSDVPISIYTGLGSQTDCRYDSQVEDIWWCSCMCCCSFWVS